MGIRGSNDFRDDPYYADLERWILKLMADDDEVAGCAIALEADGCSRNGSVISMMNMTGTYAHPFWGSIQMGGNAGTGVFIPRIKDIRTPTPEQGTRNEKPCCGKKQGKGGDRVLSLQEGTPKSAPRSIKSTPQWF
ncbi:hypothetical protein MLD38_038001 [Melastoma candidum]|uniref:Uncharacterized protein n=1 Tax=Melastoma candidum TaxID=119954 RepID=A0ACB9KY47_9MYRT|nr:hypothetical protein MLD38_038001 [Melastoma candidum]